MARTLRGQVLNIVEEYEFAVELCIECGIAMAVEKSYTAERQRDHKTFYCLNGHGQQYGGKTALELRVERAESELRVAREQRDSKARQLETAERSRAAIQGEMTKTKKRIHNGVCPECKRTFANLANHMHSKHGTPAEAEAIAAEHRK